MYHDDMKNEHEKPSNRRENHENSPDCRQWIIFGEREEGERFRPGDWVDRLAGLGARFGPDRRLRYGRDLQSVFVDGQRALRISSCLAQNDAELYRMILDFAHRNRLRMRPATQS